MSVEQILPSFHRPWDWNPGSGTCEVSTLPWGCPQPRLCFQKDLALSSVAGMSWPIFQTRGPRLREAGSTMPGPPTACQLLWLLFRFPVLTNSLRMQLSVLHQQLPESIVPRGSAGQGEHGGLHPEQALTIRRSWFPGHEQPRSSVYPLPP